MKKSQVLWLVGLGSVVVFAVTPVKCQGNAAAQPRSGVAAMSPAEQDTILGNHIVRTMEVVRSPLSSVERQLTAQLLVGVANSFFEDLDSKRDWIRVLAIESKFMQEAKSPVGATGIGQVMPQYATEFGKLCGIKGATAKDLENILVNAAISACVWRHMIEIAPDHSVILALAAYNSGPSSSSTKGIQHGGSAVAETANYISKFAYLKEVTSKPTQMDRK